MNDRKAFEESWKAAALRAELEKMDDMDEQTIADMLEGVTDGPWKVTTCADYWVEPTNAPDDGGFHGIAHCGDISWPGGEHKQREWEKNARFLAWCRGPDTGVPALIERVAALEAENKRLSDAQRERDELRAAVKVVRGKYEMLISAYGFSRASTVDECISILDKHIPAEHTEGGKP